MRRFSILILVAAAILAPAQTRTKKKTAPAPPLDPNAFPIVKIAIEGNHNFTADQIAKVAGVKVGDVVDKAKLDAAHERLVGCGAFDSVAYRYDPDLNKKGVDLTYQVVEVPTLFPLMFEELPAPDADLRAWLQQHDPLFGPKVSATKEALEHYRQLIADYLASAHDYHEPIVGRLSSENPPDLVILFRPATQRPTIAQVRATDTGEIPAGVVQSTAYGVAVGTIYSEPRFRQVLDNSIRPLYEAVGRIRVAFPQVEAEPDADVKGVVVKFSVEQGPVYKFGKVQISGADTSTIEVEAVVKKLKTGQLANFDDVKAAQDRLHDEFRHQGYLRASTEVLRTVDDDKKVVDVNIRINTGPLYTFHQLTIVGLDLEGEPVIRKLWGLAPGKAFVPDYPDHFLARVNEMGLFDDLKSTEAEQNIDQDKHTVDVTLTFKAGRAAPTKRKNPGRPF
jgi:outer membrane protein insertion porin family